MIKIYLKTECLKCGRQEIIKDDKYYLPTDKNQAYEAPDPHFNQFDSPVNINYIALDVDNKYHCSNCNERLYLSTTSETFNLPKPEGE